MKIPLVSALLLVIGLVGCHPKSSGPREVEDPVQKEIYAFRLETRQAYNQRRFDELENTAASLRSSKKIFAQGSWAIADFYGSFECNDQEAEAMWQLHDRIHQDWITAKPDSATARIAYADFLTQYAWRARGIAYAPEVKSSQWKLFEERLFSARRLLRESRDLPERDPVWAKVGLRVALGQGWPKTEYDGLTQEATAAEPKFWYYDTARAHSLLPRWHGKAGDWEAYAENAAQRPNGLGDEVYTRIVAYQRTYYSNIFKETKASWPRTRSGLEQMRQRYPNSLEIPSLTALLAWQGNDRALAQAMFKQLGDAYIPMIWKTPEIYTRCRNWAESDQ